jgi:hypothetical protein
MQKRPLVSLLVGLTLIIGLMSGCASSDAGALAGRPCDEVKNDLKQAKAEKTEQDGTPAEGEAVEAVKLLEEELKSCKKQDESSETTTTEPNNPPPDDGTAGVADSDGELRSMPLIDDNGVVVQGDSTDDPRSPASYKVAKEQGPFVTWADAVRVLGDLDWYVEAVNARKSKTGFDWEDIKKWATADGIDPRVIQVYSLEISDQEARDAVRELVGDAADRLPIARHMTCIVNTRGFGREKVQDFADCRKMVRVSLAPIVYDDKGEPVGLRGNTGIFVDCFNIWWIPRQTIKQGPPPSGAPPVTTPSGSAPPGSIPPGTIPPATLPPGTTTTTRPSTTTTTRPSTTTTTRPEGKDHTESPVTDNPNDPNEPVRPNTPEPDRPPETSPTTTQPRVDPPTTVAPPAPPPATTAPAPPPTTGCQDPMGVGLCE